MSLMIYVKTYFLCLPVFFGLDILWLGLAAKSFYQDNLGFILSPKVNWAAAVIFYLLYIVGILIFAVAPGLEAGSRSRAAVLGALFGFFTYATYDLTNLATIRNWPFKVVVVDILWGSVVCSVVAWTAFSLARWFQKG